MVYDADVVCPFCFETFQVSVDPSEGTHQNWIWDCEVCCRPIDVTAHWDEESEQYTCTAERAD